MCLDGSPPGYYMRAGSGNGTNKWVLHLMGGGWCTTLADCYNRSFTIFGSSKEWPESYELFGIFSDKPAVNPDFYNWNVVFMMYCDGGSFAGDKYKSSMFHRKCIHSLFHAGRSQTHIRASNFITGNLWNISCTIPGLYVRNWFYAPTEFLYRGYRNLKALIHHLNLEKGLNRATDVILTGCSGMKFNSTMTATTALFLFMCSRWTGSVSTLWFYQDSDCEECQLQSFCWCWVIFFFSLIGQAAIWVGTGSSQSQITIKMAT